MIKAVFKTKGQNPTEVSVSGHANYGNYGEDIVCAAVTSALEMCANGITEIAMVDATVRVEENLVSIRLPDNSTNIANAFLKAFKLHLNNLKEDYPNNIDIETMEV